MKKFVISAFMALTFSIGMSAQTVITNNYDSPITGADGQSINDDDDVEAITYGGLTYYEGPSFGLNFRGQNWNKMGFELNFYTDKSFNHFETNVNINYSIGLWKEADKMFLLTLAAGPTLNVYTGYDKNGNKETQMCSNLIINPYFAFKINKFVISAGYMIEFVKWDFEQRGTGFHIGLGYCF